MVWGRFKVLTYGKEYAALFARVLKGIPLDNVELLSNGKIPRIGQKDLLGSALTGRNGINMSPMADFYLPR